MRVKIEVANVGRLAAAVRWVELRSPWPPYMRDVQVISGPLPQVLEPTAFIESDFIDLVAPDVAVQAALAPAVPEDLIASEIVKSLRVRAEDRVRGSVRRGDSQQFNKPRRTIVEYRDEA
jgi:hypothetical protein